MKATPAPLRTNRAVSLTVLLAVADMGLTLLALFLSGEIRLALPFGKNLAEPGAMLNWQVYVLTAIIWLVVLAQFGLYTRRWARLRDEWATLAFAVLAALLILAGGLYLSFREVSRLQFLYFGILDLALLAILRAVGLNLRRVAQSEHDTWRILIAGSSQAGRSLARSLGEQQSTGVQVVGFLDDTDKLNQEIDGLRVIGTLEAEQVLEVIQRERISEIVLALPQGGRQDAYDRSLSIITELEQSPVQVSLVPDVLDLAWFGTRAEDLNGVPLLRLRESALNGPARLAKRVMDILLALVASVAAAPLLLVAAILVRLDSPGPAIIRQKRLGENAQPFDMLKLRTMIAGAESTPPDDPMLAMHKRPDDPRVTRIGRFLRRYSIDELPQLVNVLRGEMSLVGPRPDVPWLVDCYEPWQRHRFAVPPGMTGWWQIHGRSDRPLLLNVEDDLFYIRNYSLWLDVIILLRTIPVVLTGRGAY